MTASDGREFMADNFAPDDPELDAALRNPNGLKETDPIGYLNYYPGLNELQIKSIRKLGQAGGQFQLLLADDRVVELGNAEEMQSFRKVKAKIADATQVTLKDSYFKKSWDNFYEIIVKAAGPGEDLGISPTDECKAWLAAHWYSHGNAVTYDLSVKDDVLEVIHMLRDGAAASVVMMRTSMGQVILRPLKLAHFVNLNIGQRTSHADICQRLRRLEFHPELLSARDGDQILKQRAWISPVEFDVYGA